VKYDKYQNEQNEANQRGRRRNCFNVEQHDDNNMMSSTTKYDSPLLKMKITFVRSQTTTEDKWRPSRGRKRVSHGFAKQYTRNDT